MKNSVMLLLIIFSISAFGQNADTVPSEKLVFTQVEQMPEFPGGINSLMAYLGSNIHYPKTAIENCATGTVYLKFIVEEDGTIGENVLVVKGVGYGCDEESVRVVSAMPKWTPGKQNGKPVSVYYTLPVKFALDDCTKKVKTDN